MLNHVGVIIKRLEYRCSLFTVILRCFFVRIAWWCFFLPVFLIISRKRMLPRKRFLAKGYANTNLMKKEKRERTFLWNENPMLFGKPPDEKLFPNLSNTPCFCYYCCSCFLYGKPRIEWDDLFCPSVRCRHTTSYTLYIRRTIQEYFKLLFKY